MAKKIIFSLCFIIILSSNHVFAQSVGLTFESNSFNVYNFFYNSVPARGQIKNIYIQATLPLFSSVHVSLKTGYGWNTFFNTTERLSPGYYNYTQSMTTKGMPIELSLIYSQYLTKDSVFEPFISIGAGYYNYKTVSRYDYTVLIVETEYKTKGFCGLICFGANLHLTQKLLTFIEFKSYAVNGLRTKWEILNQSEHFKYEADYGSSESALNLSVSFGMLYEL
ncbi:MAG: hypothetical protein M1495_02970 [Bacteroidetes bacterium]|nr:hypothetical protein [Bacteroidota bacterium]MCL6098315.1 hypothetical protein [Bacteroidota bacterium]